MTFKDHFSSVAADYADSRPRYPAALFDFLAEAAPARNLAWDCATGNGQAAVALAEPFSSVVATDASAEQLAHAFSRPRVRYVAGRAEPSPLRTATVDLVTVAQAIHWFDLDRFFAEVSRVLVPSGVLAFWTYDLLRAGDDVDPLIDDVYFRRLAGFWPPERRLVDERYASIPMPFPPIEVPPFAMTLRWDAEAVLRYLKTWSAVPRYRSAHGKDPIDEVRSELLERWGDPTVVRDITWPLTVRCGRKN